MRGLTYTLQSYIDMLEIHLTTRPMFLMVGFLFLNISLLLTIIFLFLFLFLFFCFHRALAWYDSHRNDQI